MSYYEELKVTREATKVEIKKAFRNLSLQNHPDKGGDEEKFKKISEAYNTLMDDEKRRQYDLSFERPRGYYHGGMPGYRNPFGMFETMFNFTSGMKSGVKLPDTVYEVELHLDEVYYGTEKKIKVTTECKCECIQQCRMCNGTGQVQEIMGGRGIIKLVTNGCGTCMGRTFTSTKGVSCECCKGNGMYHKEELYTLTIDSGITEGSMLKFDEKGQQAVKANQISGDLIFKFKMLKTFSKEKKDIINSELNVDIDIKGYTVIMNIEIDIIDVVFGYRTLIKYFDKEIEIDTAKEIVEENKEYVYSKKGITSQTNDEINGPLIIKYKYRFDKLMSLGEDKRKMLLDKYKEII